MKTYLVLRAPEFRLQATLRHRPELPGEPVALLQGSGKKLLIAELNAKAQAHQVERGMTPTQATARCGGLHFIEPNSGHERAAQEAILQVAEKFSPYLESTAPGIVTVELPGERSFRAEEWRAIALQPLADLQLEIRLGLATTPALALLAARLAQPMLQVTDPTRFLAPLPIDALEPSAELRHVLGSWGIRTIGEYLALPRAEVNERLGPEAIGLWERVDPAAASPLRWVKPPEFFREETDLEYPIETLEPLLFLLRRFLDKIAFRLGQIYQVAGRLRLVLRFETGAPYRQVFTLPQPTCDVNLLFRMLHTHLENFSSSAPIIGLELAAKPVRAQAEQFSLLEPGLRDPHRFAETLARLQALLGADRVGTPQLEPSHHPEAFHLEPFTFQAKAPTPAAASEPAVDERALGGGAPWLRFRPPVSVRVILDETRPVYLHSALVTGPVEEVSGPWFSSGHWWETPGWAQEEWAVALRAGCYRLVRLAEDWFLEGVYA